VKRARRFFSLLIVATSVCLAAAQTNPARREQDLQRRLDRLEAGVQAAEAVRAVKRLQHTYGQYLGAGLWSEAADLFTEDVLAQFSDVNVTGRAALRTYFMRVAGRSGQGLPPHQLNTHLILQPIVTLGADGKTASATWHEVAMLGGLESPAWWKGGIYENDYELQADGVWKISHLRYFHQYEGTYESLGHKAPPKWNVPYHFAAAHVGVTIPESALRVASARATAEPGARLADLAQRVQRLQDETGVQNLQHSLGYYVDRKLWDDVADLFADDGTYEAGPRGKFSGKAGIRRGLEELYGASPLHYGELFDHLNLTTVATVAPDGRTARTRTTQLVMRGRNNEKAEWEVGTFENEFARDAGVWKIRAVRYYPQVTTSYEKGWGREFVGGPVPRPALAARRTNARAKAVAAASIADTLVKAERQLDGAIGIDAVENLNSSYGYYIDESDWDRMADTFATTAGGKEITGAGMYIGRERIRTILNLRGPRGGRSAAFFTIHQLTQPVIHISEDGQSAKARLRLFQLGGSADGSSGSWIGGIYENTAVKENGEWKFGIQDLHHIYNAAYRTGWAKMAAPARGRGAGQLPQYAQTFPPDRPIRARQYAFPEITEPAFHYRNPVSGRMPAELMP
jgi:hypothetical protein